MQFKCQNVMLGNDFRKNENFQMALACRPRDILSKMLCFTEKRSHRVGVLFGLRRTGKTFLLYQWLSKFPINRAACLTISTGEKFSSVLFDLDVLLENDFKYIALDEITLCTGFVNGAAILSDKYASYGMKIFMTGTDSLSLSIAKNHALFDRETTLHTSYIPYAEWSRLLEIHNIDEYLRWGGLLSLESTDGENENSVPLPWTENGRRIYFSSAISENIQNTLNNYEDYDNSDELSILLAKEKKVFDKVIYNEFSKACTTSFLNALYILSKQPRSLFQTILQSSLNDEDHVISLGLFKKKFKPNDISRLRSNLSKKNPILADEVQDIIQTILSKIEETLHVQNRDGIHINIDTLCSIEMYLKQLDVYDIYPARYLPPINPSEKELLQYEKKNRNCRDINLVCHPGLRYGQADILRTFMEEEMLVRKIPARFQDIILNIFDNTLFGIMLEETVLYEIMLACRKISGISMENKDWNKNMHAPIYAAKFKTLARNPDEPNKEIDIVVTDRRHEYAQYYLFEVKHSNTININQYRWLLDKDFIQRLSESLEEVVAKAVIYMGNETVTKDGILYCNVEKFLKLLHDDGLDHLLQYIAKQAGRS